MRKILRRIIRRISHLHIRRRLLRERDLLRLRVFFLYLWILRVRSWRKVTSHHHIGIIRKPHRWSLKHHMRGRWLRHHLSSGLRWLWGHWSLRKRGSHKLRWKSSWIKRYFFSLSSLPNIDLWLNTSLVFSIRFKSKYLFPNFTDLKCLLI